MTSSYEQASIITNGIRLNVAQAGPTNGALVVLLHGFPEFWYGWRKQIPYLAEAGYRVWAPDQRGYNLSDKPLGKSAYSLDVLAADVVGLIDAAGQETAFVVGHDWGGAVAWWLAAKHPQRLEKLVVINCPSGAVLLRELRRSRAQQLRSWYMFFFQMPWLPEAVLRRDNWRMLTRMLQASAMPGAFTGDDLALYRQAWSQPKALTAMLNWYRAMLQVPTEPAPRRPIEVPTLLIWGQQDRFLGQELARPSIDMCSTSRLVFVPDATHWVQHEQPEKLSAMLIEFLHT